MEKPSVEFLTYHPAISGKARQFLATYHPAGTIPIPIEEIIEFKLKMDIIPVPNLQKDYAIDGFLTADFSSIYVDDYIYSNREYRYRFTLAHEIGHLYLHKAMYEHYEINDLDDWLRFLDDIGDDFPKLDFQSFAFAGLLLVPPDELKARFDEKLKDAQILIDEASKNRLPRERYIDYVIDAIAKKLSPEFKVSVEVINRRIVYDSLDNLIP